MKPVITVVPQDAHLAKNQADEIRCGDNGIFKGMPLTDEQRKLSAIARTIYSQYPFDGKYILDGDRLIICQSNAETAELQEEFVFATVNPLGNWTGGTNVDTGATNRKLGSDIRVCPKANAAMTAVPNEAITITGTVMQSGVRPVTASCCPATAWMSM